MVLPTVHPSRPCFGRRTHGPLIVRSRSTSYFRPISVLLPYVFIASYLVCARTTDLTTLGHQRAGSLPSQRNINPNTELNSETQRCQASSVATETTGAYGAVAPFASGFESHFGRNSTGRSKERFARNLNCSVRRQSQTNLVTGTGCLTLDSQTEYSPGLSSCPFFFSFLCASRHHTYHSVSIALNIFTAAIPGVIMILPVPLYASSLALLSVGAAGALCITLCMYQSKQTPRRAEGRARGTLNQDVASLLLLLFG